jgi:cytochrome c oxidase subunit 2
MQTLAAQITAIFLVLLTLCFIWVLRRSSATQNPLEKIAPGAYRLRNRLFALAVVAGTVLAVVTLMPWPHDAQANQVTRHIDVKAIQWGWELSDQKAKVGEVIEFRVTSEDVNHGFGLYNEQMQMLAQIQAMPGFTNKVRHRFTEPGKYKILCMEYCGLAHHGMVADFEVAAAP